MKEDKIFEIVVVMMFLLAMGSFLSSFDITGYVVFGEGEYSDEISLDFNTTTSYIWTPNESGLLESLKLTGYFEGDYASVYLYDKLIYNFSYGNGGLDAVKISNGSGEIDLSFNYGNVPSYDSNNDGATYVGGIIDFFISGNFNFDVNYSKLCTKYIINNLGDDINTPICYGSEECCLFLDLEPRGSNWSKDLYLNYGKYGAGYTNTINAQIVYYDVDLSVPYTDIYNSELLRMDADFVQRNYFNDACVDSCSLSSYDSDSYELDIIVDGVLHVDNVSYGVGEDEISTQNLNDLGECEYGTYDFVLNATYSPSGNVYCDTLNGFEVLDETSNCGEFLQPPCWDNFTNVTIRLLENISSTGSLTGNMDSTNNLAISSSAGSCNHTGVYTINATFESATHSCYINTTLDLSSYSTNPNIVLNFTTIPNLTIGQEYNFSLIVNNIGDDNATNINGTIMASNVNINLSNSSLIANNIENGTSTTLNYSFSSSSGGEFNISTQEASIKYYRINGIEHDSLSQIFTNTFHVNYNPSLSLPNVTLRWNVSDNFSVVPFNNTLNLTETVGYFSDEDTYDDCTTVTWNYTDVTNENISINIDNSTCILNISGLNNWTGNVNVTFYVNDTYNMSDEVNVSIYLSNETVETCNGLDDDGDTLVDDDITSPRSCGSNGQQYCTDGAWTSCNDIVDTSSRTATTSDGDGSGDGLGNGEGIIPIELFAPAQKDDSNEDKTIIWEIINKRYRITREITVVGKQTQITEKIKALDIYGIKNVKLNVEIPKDIEDRASDIIKIDPFKIIKEDPIIQFELGNIESLKETKVQYLIDKRLTKRELDRIITTLELKESEDDIEELIEETNKYVDLTQEITVNRDKNQTEFKITIDYNESEAVIGDVYIYTEIPKCLIEIIKEELIESEYEFEIINEDPLIAWHFDSILDVETINYNIKAVADEDCANQAKSLAVAKKIVQVQFSPNKKNIFLMLSILPLILIIMGLFATFSKEIEHYNPKIQKLIVYIKHHFKHGFKTDHLKEKLNQEGYSKKEVDEALKLNSKNKLHYIIKRLEIGFEEFVLAALIILNILDFIELPYFIGNADYIKKIISWSILAFLLYHVSITKLILGFRKKLIDVLLIGAYFLLILKNLVGFADAAFLENLNTNGMVNDVYAYIIQNNQLFEVYFFLAGIILLSAISLWLALNEEVKAPSFLNILHFHPDKSNNITKILTRFLITKITLLAFFIVLFNLMMEWLAIAVDALILVITLGFIILLLFKHREKFTAPKLLYEIEESSEKFYEKFIKLFQYKRYIMLGVSGLLILHILTELGNFLIPYVTGIHDAIYFGNFYEGHLPLFSFTTKGLFALQTAGLSLGMKTLVLVGYALNIIAAFYLILMPAYVWYHMFKNRNLALTSIPKIKFNEFNIFMSITSISFLIFNPVFIIKSIKKIGLIGVDVQTKMLELSNLNNHILLALAIGIIALFISFKYTSLIKRIVLSLSIVFFLHYISLFFANTVMYYINSVLSLIGVQSVIAVYLFIFLILSIIFYLSGVISFFVEIYLRKELWFGRPCESWSSKHDFHFIHHPNEHNEFIHGTVEHHLEHYIKKHMIHGEQLINVQEHLAKEGWDRKIIDESSDNVMKDKHMIRFIDELNGRN
jgi:hypothetical protein